MRKLWIIILVAVAVACTQQPKSFQTESGVEVSYLVKGDGTKPMKDSIIVVQLKVANDSTTFTETTEDQPIALAYDPEMEAGHVQEVLGGLQVGDSVSFSTTAKNLFEETYQSQVPPGIDPESAVNVNMKMADQMSSDAYRAFVTQKREEQMAKEAEQLEEKLATDGEAIDAYLADQGIEPIISDSGLRYVITEEGSGANVEAGDNVTVHYDGTLLSGEAFDSSRDRGQPFTFQVGQGRVIKAWDEGLTYLKKGGKATLYVPSPLGYGSRAAGPVIKPYSILVFDVEVLDIEKSND